ncbi:MAG: NAD-glutamate dehydrogenase, partial [Dyella sp.]
MNAIRASNDGLIQSAVFDELKKSSSTPMRLEEAQFFIDAFFARIAASDRQLHSPAEWAALIADLLQFAQQRAPGRAAIRVIEQVAGHAGRSAIQVVTDDMPFLVDTVTMAAITQRQIHAVIHPVINMQRDAAGHLVALGGDAGQAESVMHFEIDRLADTQALEQLKLQLIDALDDVRAAVDDWSAMRRTALAIADELPQRPLPLDRESIVEAEQFMRWLADDNFTFLGYREYVVAESDGEQVLRA